MKQIFNTIIALVFVMTTGCTSLSLHVDYNNSKKEPKINNAQDIKDIKKFCETAHKDHKLDSSKTAIANCIVTTGFVEQNNNNELWQVLRTGFVIFVAGVAIQTALKKLSRR